MPKKMSRCETAEPGPRVMNQFGGGVFAHYTRHPSIGCVCGGAVRVVLTLFSLKALHPKLQTCDYKIGQEQYTQAYLEIEADNKLI